MKMSMSTQLKDHDAEASYDCIIVGAGTAGMGFLRGILEDGVDPSLAWRVAVVELGRPIHNNNDDDSINRCAEPLRDWYTTAHDNNKKKTRQWQARIGNRRIRIPSGSGRGGTTRINAGLCCSAETVDAHSTSYSFSAKEKQAMQHLQNVLRREQHFTDSPVPTIVHVEDGKRVNYFEGLVQPLLDKASATTTAKEISTRIEWMEGVTCRRLLHRNGKIYGVETVATGAKHPASHEKVVLARRVIVTAGVWNSPILLANSGLLHDTPQCTIPKLYVDKDQQKRDDKQITVLPLCDHVMIPVAYLHWKPKPSTTCTAKHATPAWNGVRNMQIIQLNQDYMFQVSEMDACVFPSILPDVIGDYIFGRTEWDGWETIVHPARSILKVLLQILLVWTPVQWILKKFVTALGIFLVQSPVPLNGSFSVVKEKNGVHAVHDIRLQYLRSDKDLAAIQEFWEQHLPTLAPADSWECFPGPLVRSKFRLGCSLHSQRFRIFCQQFCLPYFHWSGSLRMDRKLPEGLFICDASTLQSLPPMPPALLLAARGYLLAKELKG